MLQFERHSSGEDLLPVVVQDQLTGEIRMLAWASRAAVDATLATGRATFFSRSRKALWEKGATSGHGLDVVRVLVDCDADALVYLVDRVDASRPTCHTGAPSCFFRTLGKDGEEAGPVAPTTALARLDAVLEARRAATAAASYTKSLYDGGPRAIGAKLREEADELARAVDAESDERVVAEAADLLFHLMVAVRSRGQSFTAVLQELDRRAGTGGHDEKKARKPEALV